MKSSFRRPLVQLILFCILAFILFSPILHKSFGGDDFTVLKRVALDRQLRIKGFFRPLSDITLLLNYLAGGFNPVGYYIFSIAVHGLSSFLLFQLCQKWKWTADKDLQNKYAFIAAILFLTYPFHSECIVWGLGRASLMGGLFGIAALLTVVSGLSFGLKLSLTCLFYFVGLASYESIMLLPVMILVLLWGTREPGQEEGLSAGRTLGRRHWQWMLALGSTLLIHLAVRVAVAGGLTGNYGKGFFSAGWIYHLSNLFKVTGRMLLPPMDDPKLMILLSGSVIAILLLILIFFLKRVGQDRTKKGYCFKLLLLLAIACVAPVLSGISTRTSEADRLLYFPSFFLCAGMALFLVTLVRGSSRLVLAVVLLLAYNMIELEKGNRNWLRASAIAYSVLDTVMQQDHAKKIFVVNVPDELDGAFIYRQGLPEAVTMRGADGSRIVVVNILKRDQERLLKDSIAVVTAGNLIHIAPAVTIERRAADSLRLTGVDESGALLTWEAGAKDIVLYWNRKRLLKLEH